MQLVTHSVFLKTLGWALLNSLWQMALLWFLYMVLPYLAKNLSSRVRHGIALLVLLTGSAWFLLGLIYAGFTETGAVFTGTGLLPDQDATALWLPAAGGAFDRFVPYCALLYLGVLFFQSARYTKYYLYACRLRKRGLKKALPTLRLFVEQTAWQLGIRKKVGIWLSSLADCPMTLGFFKSVILIPIASVNRLTTRQVEAILLHELAHIKRSDYLLNLLVTLTGILFFFNPFARLLIETIRKEAENSCDDLVMQFRYDPQLYSAALLSLEKSRKQERLAMAALGKNNQVLLDRIRRITGYKTPERQKKANIPVFLSLGFFFYFSTFFHESAVPVPHPALAVYPHNLTETRDLKQPDLNNMGMFAPFPISPEKPVRSPAKSASRRPPRIDNPLVNEPDNPLRLVSITDEEGGGNAEKNEISAAIEEAGEKHFSISHEEEDPAPPLESHAGNYPFVPNGSFSYKITVDSVNRQQIREYEDQRLALESSRRLQAAVETINWKKLNTRLNTKPKKLTLRLIREALCESVEKTGRPGQKETVGEQSDESASQKINEDLKLELKILRSAKVKNAAEIHRLEQNLIRAERNLYEQNLLKQRELIKKMEDDIRKKSKIVYI